MRRCQAVHDEGRVTAFRLRAAVRTRGCATLLAAVGAFFAGPVAENALAQPLIASTLLRNSSEVDNPRQPEAMMDPGLSGSGSGRAPWWAPLASGVVPGAGQFAMGQQRSVGYAVAEAYFLVQALSARRAGDRDRDEYRSLAADVARRPFTSTRPVGSWDYYESMQKFVSSGVFDRVPGGAVEPELDETTFNGARWRLARETFWQNADSAPAVGSPAYQRALQFYTQRAVTDDFRWTWRDAQLQQDVYRQTIGSANRSYQRAVNFASVVAANHLVSLIDAYVTVRVRRYGGVRVAGLRFDGVESRVQGGPTTAIQPTVTTSIRFVPTRP